MIALFIALSVLGIVIAWSKLDILVLGFVILLWFALFIKIIIHVDKYGFKNVFRIFFKPTSDGTATGVFIDFLSKTEGIKKIIEVNNLNINYILINEYGIHLFRLIEYSGTIEGNIKDNNWSCKKGNKEPFMINNIYSELTYCKEAIKNIIKSDIPVHMYIVSANSTNFLVERNNNLNIIKKRLFVFEFKRLNQIKYITQEQVQEYYNLLLKEEL